MTTYYAIMPLDVMELEDMIGELFADIGLYDEVMEDEDVSDLMDRIERFISRYVRRDEE